MELFWTCWHLLQCHVLLSSAHWPHYPLKCFLSLSAMKRVTRHLLSVHLLVRFWPVLLDPFKVISGAIWCDGMRNKLQDRSANEYLNKIFLWGVNFVLVDLALLAWGETFFNVYISIICLVLAPATFAMNRYFIDEYGSLDLLIKLMLECKALRYSLIVSHTLWKLGWFWSILAS